MVVYTPQLTPRIQYTFESLIPALTGCKVQLTTNEQDPHQLAYHHQAAPNALQIEPGGLLHSETLSAEIHLEGDRILVNGFHDPASFIFWMAARIEEYGVFTADSHGRFPASSSWAFQNRMHLSPIAEMVARQLIEQAGVKNAEKPITKVMTVDIDQPLLFQRGIIYNLLKSLKHLILGNTHYIKFLLKNRDPWNIYQKLSKHFTHAELYIFCLLADYGYPDNGCADIQTWKQIVLDAGPTVQFGLHPSYASNASEDLLDRELGLYHAVFGAPPLRSRQHFLKLSLPETYRTLVGKGITEDYTMGWADQVGFRAGISRPFPWFDAAQNRALPLTVVPFCAMDVTMKNYMKLSISEAEALLKYIYDNLPGGAKFITLWHNESLSGFGEWKDWDRLAQEIYNL